MTHDAEDRAADVTRDADGIVVLRFRDGAFMRAHNTREVMQLHIEAAGGTPCPALADLRRLGGGTWEARTAASAEELAAVVERLAVLVGSPATRMMGSFFVRVTRPPYPTRVFTDEAEARRWLLEGDPT